MKTIHYIITFLAIGAVIVFSSCSHRLAGTWNVQKYETETPGQEATALQNIGTITFKQNGTGEKNLDYMVLGYQRKDNQPFKWSATDQYVTIDSQNSDFGKTWILTKNKAKFQQWKSTDGRNQVQVIELSKQ